jgi:hypothetical protein
MQRAAASAVSSRGSVRFYPGAAMWIAFNTFSNTTCSVTIHTVLCEPAEDRDRGLSESRREFGAAITTALRREAITVQKLNLSVPYKSELRANVS